MDRSYIAVDQLPIYLLPSDTQKANKNRISTRNTREQYTYKGEEILKVSRIIRDLTLMIYCTKIHAYELRAISLTKACGLVWTKSSIGNRLRDIFKNLRG